MNVANGGEMVVGVGACRWVGDEFGHPTINFFFARG